MPLGRRTVKPWGDGRWFIEFTKQQCAALNAAPGDRIPLSLHAAPDIPPELEVRLKESGLWEVWWGRSAAQRRAVCEAIFAAKRETTRQTRIERLLDELKNS